MTMASAHGENGISVAGNIVTVEITGGYNKEGVVTLCEKLYQIIDSFEMQPFKMLVHYLNIGGGTPEAFAEVEVFNNWLNKKNLAAKAIVIQSQVIADMLDARAPSRNLQNSCYFTDMGAAQQWLEKQ